jgi:uncharacterized protein (DUF433 family)
MASLDWSQCPAVESIPGKVSGAWVLRGTRTPVKVLFENLEAGMSIDELMEPFPVSRQEIDSLMAFIARALSKRPRVIGSPPRRWRGLAATWCSRTVEGASPRGTRCFLALPWEKERN